MKTTIWVGYIEQNALVYDPVIQLQNCPHVFLWDPSSGEMRTFLADIVRTQIKPQTNHAIAAEYIERYQKWHISQGEAWKNDERLYYETRQREEEAQKANRLERERAKAAALAEA